tara:strand:+ start:1115 stop:2119 length:1005 start_codon:yes stop_codon:yes gene_type:complete
MFKDKSILVTGGTGSFGKAFINYIIKKNPNFKRLVVFSRDELKQFEMSKQKNFQHPNLRMFLGDIRDKERLKRALEGIEFVIHAAALKQVPTAEYNPFEFIKTNIVGTQNLVEACIDSEVKKVIALSTDKASSPINLYGATKLCSDKLILSANNIKGKRNLSFSVVRYGNVMGSRGSVIPFFLKIYSNKKKLPLTDINMTRFNISMSHAIKLVENGMKSATGGEIIVPKLKSFNIKDLIEAITRKKNYFHIVGIRPGEKIHEELISQAEAKNTLEFKDHYRIYPNLNSKDIQLLQKKMKCTSINNNFSYNSGTNAHFMKINEIRKLISDLDKKI